MMSMAGCRVVVTRPAEQADELAAPLRALGASVRVRPLLRAGPPADPAALGSAMARLDGYHWIAFTSANAVRRCVALAAPGARWPAVACVGPGTARAAREAGLTVDLMPEVYTGAALGEALAGRLRAGGGRVLWPRASGARDTFGAVLRAAGAVVDDVECYRTEPDAAAAARLACELASEPADLLVFTSPSAVRCYAAAGQPPAGAAVAVIGSITAEAVRLSGWKEAVMPAHHTVEGLVAALAGWWHGGRGGP